MARFDVYRNAGGSGYLLDVQSDLLSDLNTRVVVPLMPVDQAPRPARHLNPVFEIENAQVVMVTQFLAAIPATELKRPLCGLQSAQDEIRAALDLLFVGF